MCACGHAGLRACVTVRSQGLGYHPCAQTHTISKLSASMRKRYFSKLSEMDVLCYFFFFLETRSLRQALAVLKLTLWPGWPQIRDLPICFPSAGTKSEHHHAWFVLCYYTKLNRYYEHHYWWLCTKLHSILWSLFHFYSLYWGSSLGTQTY